MAQVSQPDASVPFWDARYAQPGFLFGETPNVFLQSQAFRLTLGQSVLAVADGEGRNGVWLAEQGLKVHAIDASPVAMAKSQALAAQRKVNLRWEQADLLAWVWPEAAYDVIAAIFI